MKREIQTQYTTKFINQNFRIKVFGHTESGEKVNTLMGVSGIIQMIGEDMLYKMVRRSLDSIQDVCHCKLRRGIQVSFYVK